MTLAKAGDAAAIPCTIAVNEMMGSELHLHVVTFDGDKLIVRIPTVSLEDEERKSLVAGATIYVTFEGKVMHFFNAETEENLLV
jgi:multiple sugar transport system ATP-binding protein